jgi:transcriptional regulator with PAS, ATPase and Fis domain
MARAPSPLTDTIAAAGAAVEELAGAALVLDRALRIVLATEAAERLLGFPVPTGESAPKVLCGQKRQRPVAEALAAGRAVRASIPHPGRAEGELSVRALPLGEPDKPAAWLLLLDETSAAGVEGPVEFHGMWTQDAAMKQMFHVIERVAAEDVTVLVRGETGAGKELVAHALHALSPRHSGPFRALNCAALPPSLLESELFGHARGAFTGAVRDVQGHIQLAHRGTLFLDEVAELPLELQAKLLRVLETHTVLPVGARDPVPVDVRIVSATHRALRKEVEAGRFRADLMYRLRVIPIFIPALRERPKDIRLLCERFIVELNARHRRRIERIAPSALRVLERWPFPGNVRELRNVLAYAYAIGDGPVLLPSDLPPEMLTADEATAPTAADEREPAPGDGEVERIRKVLDRVGGNRARAARVLGLSRVTLWRRMRELGLAAPRHRPR